LRSPPSGLIAGR